MKPILAVALAALTLTLLSGCGIDGGPERPGQPGVAAPPISIGGDARMGVTYRS